MADPKPDQFWIVFTYAGLTGLYCLFNTMGHLISILCFLWYLPMHGDVHQRILEVTRAIEAHPDSLLLYQIRGELYLLHEEPDSAYTDFQFCRSRQFNSSRVYLGLSRCVEFAGDSALYFVDQALLSDPGMLGALEWKARLLLLMQNPCEAAITYEYLLAIAADPSPALYIDASHAWKMCADSDGKRRAIEVLRNGLDRLGPIQVIQKELVIQYQQQEKYQEALLVQNEIVDQASHKAKPLMIRAAIHNAMGEINAAKQDLQQALLFLDHTPAHRSGTPAMMALRQNILSLLDEIDR